MARERYQPQPRFESESAKDEFQLESNVSQASETGRTPKPMNSDPDGYVPGRVNQTECIARLGAAGLLTGFVTYEACGSELSERILRTALALDSLEPISPEVIGDLYLTYMHEPVIDGGRILFNAAIGYGNRKRIDWPKLGIGTNGHKVTFKDEMDRLCGRV